MTSEPSSAAALYAHPLARPAGAAGSSSREAPTVGVFAAAGATLGRGLRCVISALAGLGEIVAIAYAFPLVILAVGIPVALLIRLMMWIVRAL